MSIAGWIIMVVSVGGTTGFFAWCIWRVLQPPDKTPKMHGVLDTEVEIEERERRGKP